jgi:3-deoxy-D-manno-octulosonic-acid transferase
MEREVWPNLFRECTRRSVPIVLASARISAPSAERHRKLAGLFAPALARNVTIAAQTQADAERYRAIGADPSALHVAGNVKFDLDVPPETRAIGASLRNAHFPGRPVWVAGSTHEGEEEILLNAHRRVLERLPDALLILAPRHPNRFAGVAAWLRSRGISFTARSAKTAVPARDPVLLADTLGELVALYSAADVAFVGGTLTPIGGHNLLEPAASSAPIIIGPYNFNAPDIAQMFVKTGAAIEVRSGEQLADALVDLLGDARRREDMGAKARSIVDANRGALGRVMQLIESLRRL